jgi:hypothetical protein
MNKSSCDSKGSFVCYVVLAESHGLINESLSRDVKEG